MVLPDALSRLCSSKNKLIELHLRIENHGFTNKRIRQISTDTQAYPILSIVHDLTQNGWPNRKIRVPRIARRYWDQRDELSMQDNLLMKDPG